MHINTIQPQLPDWDASCPGVQMTGAEFALPWILDRMNETLLKFRSTFTRPEATLFFLMQQGDNANPRQEGMMTLECLQSLAAHSEKQEVREIDAELFLGKFVMFDEQQMILLRLWAAAFSETGAAEGISLQRYMGL